MQVDYQKHTLELQELGWIVHIHAQKSDKYALTRRGMDYLRFYKGVISSENSSLENNQIWSEKCLWMLQNGIIATHYDLDYECDRISPTPYGFGLFATMEFLLDERLQKRAERKTKSMTLLYKSKKLLASLVEKTNQDNTVLGNLSEGYRGHIK